MTAAAPARFQQVYDTAYALRHHREIGEVSADVLAEAEAYNEAIAEKYSDGFRPENWRS